MRRNLGSTAFAAVGGKGMGPDAQSAVSQPTVDLLAGPALPNELARRLREEERKAAQARPLSTF